MCKPLWMLIKSGNVTFKNGIAKYGYGKKNKAIKGKPNAEIVILDAFTDNEATDTKQRIDEAKELKLDIEEELSNIYKPISQIKEVETKGEKKSVMKTTSFKILLKKVAMLSIEILYNNYNASNDNTIILKDTDIAKFFKMDRGNINREMSKVLVALSQIQIRSFRWGKKMYSKRNGTKEEIPDLAVVNLVQDAFHTSGISYITFNEKYSKFISLCSVVQTPYQIYQVKDALTFDLILYLYGQVREKKSNKFKIKVQTIYDTIKQIPRYEDVKGRNYAREIYQPLREAMDYLGKDFEDKKGNLKKGLNIINIDYENTDYIKSNGKYDFNKWLQTNLVVEFIQEPNLKTLRDSREKHKKLAEKNK